MSFPSQLAFYTPQTLGFYLPPLVMWALVALVPFLALRWIIGRLGLYRLVWHRPLFDAALYVIMLGAVMLAVPALAGGLR